MKKMVEEYARRYELMKSAEEMVKRIGTVPIHEGDSDYIDLGNAKYRANEYMNCVERLFMGIKEDIFWEIMDMSWQKRFKTFGFKFTPTDDIINEAFYMFEGQSWTDPFKGFTHCLEYAVNRGKNDKREA